MKLQPSPKREKADTAREGEPAPAIEVSFDQLTIMEKPLLSTAAILAKIRLQEQLNPAKTPPGPSLPPNFPEMPSSPTPDNILEWLGSSQPPRSFPCPRSLRPASPSKFSPYQLKAAKLSMAETPLPQPKFLRSSNRKAMVGHIEHRAEEKLVIVPESRLQMLEARMRKAELATQLSDLEKEILKISLRDEDFVTEEQQILEDDTELKTLKKSAEAGFELLNTIQYDNPICKDDPNVFQEAYEHWVLLRQSVATYLFNRSGAQHEIQIKREKYVDLRQKRKTLLTETEDVNAVISKLEHRCGDTTESKASSTDSKEPPKTDIDQKKPPRRDSGIAMLDPEKDPYFPSSPGLAILLAVGNDKLADSKEAEKPNRSRNPEYIVQPRYISSRPEVNAKVHFSELPNSGTKAGYKSSGVE